MSVYALDKLMGEARRLAAEFRRATGKPLVVGGEIARFDASRLLDLELVNAPNAGFDAIGRGPRAGQRVQIKGRAVFANQRSAQRVGELRITRQWDILMVVLMDDAFEPTEIIEIPRETVIALLEQTNGSQRRSRGTLTVARLRATGTVAWSRPTAGSQVG